MGGHNVEAKREIERLVAGLARPVTGPLDAAFVAPVDEDEALYFAWKLRGRLLPGGQVWIIDPPASNLVAPLAAMGYAAADTHLTSGTVRATGFFLSKPGAPAA